MPGEREEAVSLLAQGMSTEQVARRLGVRAGTVRAWKAHGTMGTYGAAPLLAPASDDADGETPLMSGVVAEAEELKFGLEKDLHQAVRSNIAQLEPGLRIIDGGKERHVETGFIDILAEDTAQRLVVIELKVGPAPQDVVAQILGYMGDLAQTEEREVRGIVIAAEFSNRLRSAARAGGLRLVSYTYRFSFTDV